jgi:hypothetical protein
MGEIQPAGPDRRRASDQDRDRVAAALGEALATGRLDPVEHEERLEAVYRAKTLGELEPLTRDLPPAVLGSGGTAHARTLALFSKIRRQGTWTVPARSEARAVLGAVVLNLRDAVFAEREITIDASSVFGKVEMWVPDNARVMDSGTALFGKRTLPPGAASGEDGPVIHIRGRSVFGHIRVHRGEPWRWPWPAPGHHSRDLPPPPQRS